ncbi:MAG: MG2 domain-containing protein [Breznakibacter sp.]
MNKYLSLLMLLSLGLCLHSCIDLNKPTGSSSTAYHPKVSAFTSGLVANQSAVRVEFSEPVPGAEPGKQASPSVIAIKPSIKGQLVWEDVQTLVLKPAKKFVSGQRFDVAVNLSAIFPNEKETFNFSFEVMKQDFFFEKVNLRPNDLNDLKINSFIGRLNFADFEEDENVEKVIKVTQNGQKLNLTWEHAQGSNQHIFTAQGVERGETTGAITVEWDGKPIGISKSGNETIEIPALGDFKIMDVRTQQSPAQSIQLVFSDPIQQNQDLSGLITANGIGRMRYSIDANVVSIFFASRVTGSFNLVIYPGIKNSLGLPFKEQATYSLAFEVPKPKVEIIGKGTILPDSKGLILPFKTVSIRAVEVQVIKIYENNVASFLQTNTLDGNDELRRAGKLVVKKIILLDDNKNLDLTQWNTFSLDLATLITPDPGAIYRVVMNIRKEFSVYPCEGEPNQNEPITDKGITEDDIIYWETPSPYHYSNWDSYEEDMDWDWDQRENPCHPMYYRNLAVSRNVLASNIGLVAKCGSDKELFVAVSDLVSTAPIANADIEVYDYQNQLVGQKKSGSDGTVRVACTHKPYLVIAKHQRQRGYLRVDDASALSLSRFDISGQTVKKGLKGFIYGERGVWRPGDTLFVSFMLEDKQNALPKGHPIIFELSNAQGQLVTRQTASLNETGLYAFRVATPPSAQTGMWLAKVLVGGTAFEKTMRVETVKPNRLKIELDFGTSVIRSDDPVSAELRSKWLHGAIAKNLKARVTATLYPTQTTFKSYSDYVFDDPARSFSAEEVTVFDGQLNEQGVASIKPVLKVSETAPGMLRASFVTRVFEQGGDFSIDRFSVNFSPFKSYVGIRTPQGDKRGMLLTNTLHTIQVATLDANGNPVSRQNLRYQIYKVQWRWWWESGEDDLARYAGSVSENLVASGTLSTSNGKGSFKFQIKYPEWGRYLIRVTDMQGGHAAGKTVYVDWPGWALKPMGNNPQDAAMLNFTAEKEKYAIGEKATLSFPSPDKGRALVSIETGSRVLNAFWVETKKGLTQASFDITPDMAPNIYAHVTLVQPHNQADNNLPIRLYGVIPLLVENPDTHLAPVIDMPKELQPDKEVAITVKEAKGKKMSYTLAIVDDGLLDLTRFATPDPWNSFYAREALGVKTWDLYDYVMGAYGGKIERAFSLGGDDELAGKKGGQKANRFKPMVKFAGPFTLEKGKSQTHRFVMPRYIGSVRTMVVACNQGSYGQAEVTTPVRKPLMVLATLPRVLGVGEKVKLPVSVFAMKDNLGNVDVSVNASGPVQVVGEKTKRLNFGAQGDQIATFDLDIASKTGVAKIKFQASSGKESAEDEIEIEVRNPNPPITKTVEKTIDANASATLSYTLPGIDGTNRAVMEISSVPPIDFGTRLKYLLAYPHGCIEQTTSAAFPQLFIGDVVEQAKPLRDKMEENVRAAIVRLKSMARTDGGFGYWPGATQSDDWGSSYAGHFLIEAEKKGFILPINLKKDWIDYQKRQARQWNKPSNGYAGYSMLAQAYRLYTLALAGEAEMSAMNRLRNEPKLAVAAQWRLAATYALAGQHSVATQLIENIALSEAVPAGTYDYTYGSEERNSALVIETFTLLKQREKAMPLVIQLSKQLSGGNWMSTQATAYSLLAISHFIGDKSTTKEMKFSLTIDGKKKGTFTQNKPLYADSLAIRTNSGEVGIANHTNSVLYARVVLEGIPAAGEETAYSNNLKIAVEYTDLKGLPVDVSKLPQGTDFKATVRITNPGTMGGYKNLALSQIFPSGWEIRNTRMEDGPSAYEGDVPTYRDIRDDRVYSYFDLGANQTKKMVIVLNAAYKGTFYLPGVNGEAMYDKTISALVPGKWVTVE